MLRSRYLVLFLLFGLLVPLPAYQQVPFVQCSDPVRLPGETGALPHVLGCTLENLLAVPVRIYNFLLGLAAVVLLLVIIWAGLRMILFHLSDMPEGELANAKLTLTRGIFGFLIIAAAYLIVNLLLYLLCLDRYSYVAMELSRFGIFAGCVY